jgi:uncharacterized Rossmann fold enzyme
MDERYFFERNLLALASSDPELARRLTKSITTQGRYKNLLSRTGETVPALVDNSGAAHPLHSLMDPRREGKRLVETLRGGGFIVFLGLGGGFAVEAALERSDVTGIAIVEYDIDACAELLASKEYIKIFGDPRVHLLVDPDEKELRDFILQTYQPALFGGISVLPLRTRLEWAEATFNRATETIRSAIDAISDDYSVQAYFGKRWFSNTIRNVRVADRIQEPLAPIRNIAITAAGPSLDDQIGLLKEKRSSHYLLATDTSLPALLAQDLQPDAVISIDCQHISYYHFMRGIPKNTTLFLDLASPPLVASQAPQPRFFSGGHPLTRYVSQHWRPFPQIDTSGGNVTYAAVVLADLLGAERIELYGADFSYPQGSSYARETYIHTYFQKFQNRFLPLETEFIQFLFRNESLDRVFSRGFWRYETKPLEGYRKKLERLSQTLGAQLVPIPGRGHPIDVGLVKPPRIRGAIPLFSSGRSNSTSDDFLRGYRERLGELTPLQGSLASYLSKLDGESRDLLMTLLPTAAALKKKNPHLTPGETIEAVKAFGIAELDRLLKPSQGPIADEGFIHANIGAGAVGQ